MSDRYGQDAILYQVVSGSGDLSVLPEGELTVSYQDLTISVDIPADPGSVENPTTHGEISGRLSRTYEVIEQEFSTGEVADSEIQFSSRGGWDPDNSRLPFFPQGFAIGAISIPNFTEAGVEDWIIECDDRSLVVEPIRTIEGFSVTDVEPTTWSRQ